MKEILVVGSGHTLWDDLEHLGGWSGDWMALNYAGILVGVEREPRDKFVYGWGFDVENQAPLTHWFSVHGEIMHAWVATRRHNVQLATSPDLETHSTRGDVDRIWTLRRRGRVSSALQACEVCVGLGYDKIILAGVPMDDGPHFYGRPHEVTSFGKMAENWEPWLDNLEGKVYPISGNLVNVLGQRYL